MPLGKAEIIPVILQNALKSAILIVQTVFNYVCIFLYILKVFSDIALTHNKTIIPDAVTVFFRKVFFPVKRNIMAVIPASEGEDADYEVSILKSVEEDGENILCIIEDEEELRTVYDIIMDELYEEE